MALRRKKESRSRNSDSNHTKSLSNNNFDESTYVKVNDRITEFYKQYPEGVLHTVRLEVEGGVVFKTYVLRHDDDVTRYSVTGVAKANGHSFLPDEAREDMKVEEFAETVSVGRALAKFGISIEKGIASEEEMDQFSRVHKGEAPQDEEEDFEEEEDSETEEDSEEDSEDEETSELPKLKTARKFTRGSRFARNA